MSRLFWFPHYLFVGIPVATHPIVEERGTRTKNTKMILRLPSSSSSSLSILTILLAVSSTADAYSPNSLQRPRFTYGGSAASVVGGTSPTEEAAAPTSCSAAGVASLTQSQTDVRGILRRRRSGLPLHVIAPEDTSTETTSGSNGGDVVRRRVAAGVAQVEKAAEAALLHRQQQQQTQTSDEEQRSQSPGFVGFRPRQRPFGRSSTSSDDDDNKGKVDRFD